MDVVEQTAFSSVGQAKQFYNLKHTSERASKIRVLCSFLDLILFHRQIPVFGKMNLNSCFSVFYYFPVRLPVIISYEGIHQVETYEYPKEAVREALLNALAHKMYEGYGISICLQVTPEAVQHAFGGHHPRVGW
ncbi:hypothetical protein SAMN05216436_12832 [bacterium A37T11]|nr:hypothetical protein SAMN05216436_12832 [bacterium A37T11]